MLRCLEAILHFHQTNSGFIGCTKGAKIRSFWLIDGYRFDNKKTCVFEGFFSNTRKGLQSKILLESLGFQKDPQKFGKITMHKLAEHPKTKKDVPPPPPETEHVT